MKVIIFLSFFFSFSSLSFGQCLSKDSYQRCDYDVESVSLNGSSTPLFFYQSDDLDRSEEVHYVLFLHGRGYSRDSGASGSMLDDLGLKRVFQEVGDQVIFVAPQDRFFHEDSRSVGQDYWLGIDGRDWQSFLANELVNLVEENAISQGIQKSSFNSVVGISMGAHGAFMLGQNHPERFEHVGVISPVFRPIPEEMPMSDRDVFLKDDKFVDESRNMGAAILNGNFKFQSKTVVTISYEDFALDEEKFPVALKVWDRLLESQSPMSDIEISNQKGGHSMSFWRESIGKVLIKSFQ